MTDFKTLIVLKEMEHLKHLMDDTQQPKSAKLIKSDLFMQLMSNF